MALRAVIDHPKFKRLKAILGFNMRETLGTLEGLWHFCGRYTPCGDVGKYDNDEIEAWLEWAGEKGELIAALVQSRWLDVDATHRLLVHDWAKHADDATRQALKRASLSFAVATLSGQCSYGVPTVSALPVPEPEADIYVGKPPKRFQKPTISELEAVFAAKGLPLSEASKFYNHYESKGWVIGKSPMKSWPGAVGTWEHNYRERNPLAARTNGTLDPAQVAKGNQ